MIVPLPPSLHIRIATSFFVLLLVLAGCGFAREPVAPPQPVPPEEGVFILANMFSSTVLELKDGRFRYWFESDMKLPSEPQYPLAGKYSLTGDTITLNHPDIYQKQWTFRRFKGQVTLWRSGAIDFYEQKKQLDPWGILFKTNKPAEQAWALRHGPPARKRNSPAQVEPKFRAMTIDDRIELGCGVAVADVDGDGLPDILLADRKRFVWYRNPGAKKSGEPGAWRKFVIAENLTANDNACIAAADIDGDGKCEIAVGTGWNPGDMESSGGLFYLIPPADRTQLWEPVKLPAEPTVHRMRWIKVDYRPKAPAPDGAVPSQGKAVASKPTDGLLNELRQKWLLVVAPLHGQGNKNGDGAGSRILFYEPPAPLNERTAAWKTGVIADSMHETHGFHAIDGGSGRNITSGLHIAGREGVQHYSHRMDGAWFSRPRPEDHVGQAAGAGEVCGSHWHGLGFLATIEPMDGNRLMVYVASRKPDGPTFEPGRLLTDRLVEGHALACDDLLDIGGDQIVVGWRGSPSLPEARVGIKLFTPLDANRREWRETVIDDNTIACEDLQLADLNGDGKLDIVACGRATRNLKVYFNETASPAQP